MLYNFELMIYLGDNSRHIIGFRVPELNKIRGLVQFSSLGDLEQFGEAILKYCDEQKAPIPENILKAFDEGDNRQLA